MSRPASSRRSFLAAGAATAWAAGSVAAIYAASAEPDPIFALIAAERRAWDEFSQAVRYRNDLEEEFNKTEWNRPRRALHGHMLPVHGGDPTPVYMSAGDIRAVHEHETAINRWCRSEDKRAERQAEIDARRDVFNARLVEDGEAIQAAEAAFGLTDAERLTDEASDRHGEVMAAVVAVRPRTVDGLLALLDLVWERGEEDLETGTLVAEPVKAAFAAVRAFVTEGRHV